MNAELNAELKAKWIAVLRSGKYTQHFGGYFGNVAGEACALGVYWDLVGRPPNYTTPFPFYNEIVYLNDDMRLSFEEIADWIESNVPPTSIK